MKKMSLLLLSLVLLSGTMLFASVTESQCTKKGENYIFAGGECIQFVAYSGIEDGVINIIVHGTWDSGTNTLGRYGPFAETMAFNTDITTIAVALPGYSDSSTNNIEDLKHGANMVYTKEYIDFTASLIEALKEKFEAEVANYMGHSAGASLGANMLTQHPDVITTLTAVGGRYSLEKFSKEKQKGLISIGEHLDKIGDTQILLVYGTADKISPPKVTINFYEKAKNEGLNVSLIEAKGAPHIDLDMTDAAVEAFTDMVTE